MVIVSDGLTKELMSYLPSHKAYMEVKLTDCLLLKASLQVLEEDTAQLWWAGKEMQRGKKLQDFIGKNEKTKLIAKLQKVCQ